MSATNTAVDLMGGRSGARLCGSIRRMEMKITDEAVEAFTQYRRKQIAELRPWQPGDDMTSVSVSPEDTKAGSPKPGDMIARNPKNHADQWLVAAAYFADNFEPLAALPHLSQGAVRVEVAVLRLLDHWDKNSGPEKRGVFEGVEYWSPSGRMVDTEFIAGLRSALSSSPVGVTDEVAKNSWRSNDDIATELIDAASDADADGRIADARFMRIAASRLEALASHEPAPDVANDESERVDADANAMAWGAELKSAEARNLELEADLEIANDKLRVANEALEPFAIVAEHDIGEGESDDDIFWPISNARYSMAGRLRVGHLRRARAALGRQSNG